MGILKIERKLQANFCSIIFRFPPPHIFVSEGENTNYAEAFFIPRIFSEFASTDSQLPQSIDFFVVFVK